MIDLHNHLLPGIDDGAADIEASVALARLAVAEGITHLVCTPHIHPGRYENTPETIAAAKQRFVSALADAAIELQVAAAAEVRFGMELMLGIGQKQIPFLGEWEGRKVLLLEFPHGEIPFGAERLTQWRWSCWRRTALPFWPPMPTTPNIGRHCCMPESKPQPRLLVRPGPGRW